MFVEFLSHIDWIQTVATVIVFLLTIGGIYVLGRFFGWNAFRSGSGSLSGLKQRKPGQRYTGHVEVRASAGDGGAGEEVSGEARRTAQEIDIRFRSRKLYIAFYVMTLVTILLLDGKVGEDTWKEVIFWANVIYIGGNGWEHFVNKKDLDTDD